MSKILIVDDEIQIRSLLARMLELEGYVRLAIVKLLSNNLKSNRPMWFCVMFFFLMGMGWI